MANNEQFENFKKMIRHPHIRICCPSRMVCFPSCTVYCPAHVVVYPLCTDKQLEAEFWFIYENSRKDAIYSLGLLNEYRPELARKIATEVAERILNFLETFPFSKP